MSERLQAKFLQVLDDQTFRRVGGVENLRVNVRRIAATNKNLEQHIRQGKFREDFYYRLNVIPITVPRLRERREDIPELVMRFMQHYSREFRKEIREISPEALRALVDHPWPGNVRELKNVVERAVLLAASNVLEKGDIVIGSPLGDRETFELPAGGIEPEQVERSMFARAMAQAGGHLVRTAMLLGISKDAPRYRIKKYKLTRPTGRPVAL